MTYCQLRTNKGAIHVWKFKMGKTEDPGCRHCGKGTETGETAEGGLD